MSDFPRIAPQLATPVATGARKPAAGSGARTALSPEDPRVRNSGLALVLVISGVLNLHRLSQNGYANIFYSAGVKSMLRSLHNFVFVAFDPGGLVTVDKPPLALWVQAASAKIFGFSPMSLLVPEALAGMLAVGALYLIVARRAGTLAALAGALTMAVFPSFVAVSRDNGVDPLLILLMVLACGAGLRATEGGRLRWLLGSAVLIGLAFNTKTLAAFLVVPGIALAYLVGAPSSLPRRVGMLALAGVVMLAVSFSWIAFVELTPASQRPFVGSSTNNTELGLTFEYNGFGRVEGQVGGPGEIPFGTGARARSTVKAHPKPAPPPARPAHTKTGEGGRVILPNGRYAEPIAFGGSPGPIRLFGVGLGDQAGWMLAFALVGTLGAVLVLLLEPEGPAEGAGGIPRPRRRDPLLACTIVFACWLLVEYVILSTSKGIVHPYYVSALAPGVGAMTGLGILAFARLARGRYRALGIGLALMAIAATVGVEVVLMHRMGYRLWFVPILIVGAGVGVGLLLVRRNLAGPALALTLCVLLVMPAAYSASTWLAPVEGTFAAAGPKQAPGVGGVSINGNSLAVDRALIRYVQSHRPGSRWALLTVASDTVAPMILLGLNGGAVGGYSGNDPSLDGASLAQLVRSGLARYVLLGGDYSTRGGDKATRAVAQACRELTATEWHSPIPYPYGRVLFDCAGREAALAAA
jgi:4-amino-4-deoxy-L-arabinose transferase-like glycosyltransferase